MQRILHGLSLCNSAYLEKVSPEETDTRFLSCSKSLLSSTRIEYASPEVIRICLGRFLVRSLQSSGNHVSILGSIVVHSVRSLDAAQNVWMIAIDVKCSGVPRSKFGRVHEKSMVMSSAVCVKLFRNDTFASQSRKNCVNSPWIETVGLRIREEAIFGLETKGHVTGSRKFKRWCLILYTTVGPRPGSNI